MRHEQEKNLLYDQRITEVEHGSFTPLAYSTSGGMGPSITIALQVPSGSAGRKEGQRCSLVMTWLRCRLPFSLLWSLITAFRGSRIARFHHQSTQQIELAAAEVSCNHSSDVFNWTTMPLLRTEPLDTSFLFLPPMLTYPVDNFLNNSWMAFSKSTRSEMIDQHYESGSSKPHGGI